MSVAGTSTLLIFGPDQIRYVLSQAPEPFASDPEPKRSGMSKFQPHALTISRGEHWTDRRQFTDAVLTCAAERLSGRVDIIAVEEARAIPDDLDWPRFNAAVQQMARRIILGDNATGDSEISTQLATLMTKANPPGTGDDELFRAFFIALDRYVQAAEFGTLVSLFGEAPVSDVTYPTHQVIHWMFAMGDTLAINLWRCLAVLAVHPDILTKAQSAVDARDARDYLRGCLCEAMRLWPSTPVLARTTTHAVKWNGVEVPQGTQVMIVNTFNHRDGSRVPDADTFNPTAWIDGSAASSWSFNFFSHGPQGCPGADLALRLGVAVLVELLGDRNPVLANIKLDPSCPLPLTLDYSRLRIRFAPRTTR